MNCILALDPATVTGWALWKPGLKKPRAGVMRVPKTEDMGLLGRAFLDWVIPFCKLEGVTHIVIEAPIVAFHRAHGPDGKPVGPVSIDLKVVRRIVSLVTFAELAAHDLGVTCSETPRSTVAKHFTGNGGGKRVEIKQRCLVMCQKTGWPVKSQDVADALATLDHYCWNNEIETPWDSSPRTPLFAGAAPSHAGKALSKDGDFL